MTARHCCHVPLLPPAAAALAMAGLVPSPGPASTLSSWLMWLKWMASTCVLYTDLQRHGCT